VAMTQAPTDWTAAVTRATAPCQALTSGALGDALAIAGHVDGRVQWRERGA